MYKWRITETVFLAQIFCNKYRCMCKPCTIFSQIDVGLISNPNEDSCWRFIKNGGRYKRGTTEISFSKIQCPTNWSCHLVEINPKLEACSEFMIHMSWRKWSREKLHLRQKIDHLRTQKRKSLKKEWRKVAQCNLTRVRGRKCREVSHLSLLRMTRCAGKCSQVQATAGKWRQLQARAG